jgi:hypothetical protein
MFMVYLKILVAAVFSTSVMTAFSYILSAAFRKLYKEPLLLQFLMTVWGFELSPVAKQITGWLVHYLIGLFFVIIFHLGLHAGCYGVNGLTGLVFGVIIGSIGMMGWAVMFALSDHRPKIHFSEYYIQLFFAHLVFAAGTILAYAVL